MVLALLQALGKPNVALSQVSEDWSLRGIGVSDDMRIASKLAGKFNYVNTYYHQSPKLDLCAVDEQWKDTCRFVICSDVLEHVPDPVETALKGLFSILQQGGFAVISVPYKPDGETEEFYPGLASYEVVDGNVVWHDIDGSRHVDSSPEFHGGPGQTLAFRLWSLSGLIEALKLAGFVHVAEMSFDVLLGVPSFGLDDSFFRPGLGDSVLLAYK